MNRHQLATLSGCLFLIGSAEVVAGPMMGLMGAHFNVSSSEVAYLPAAYGLTYGGIALLAGPLSDHFGRKVPLQLGLAGFAVFSALIPESPTLSIAIALSALTGMCAAAIQPNALSLVADLSPPEEVSHNIGHVFIGLMLAFVLTPALAGRIADTVGWAFAYRALSLLALFVMIAVSIGFVRNSSIHTKGIGSAAAFLSIHRGALTTPSVCLRLCSSYLWLGWVAGFGAIVAEVASRKVDISPTQAGLLTAFFGLLIIVGNLSNRLLLRLLGDVALPATALASAIGILLFLLPLNSTWHLACIGAVWAFGYGCAGPLHHARLNSLSVQYRGTVNSYHASLLNLGIFSVSGLMGLLAQTTSVTPFCIAVGTIALVGSLPLWRKVSVQ